MVLWLTLSLRAISRTGSVTAFSQKVENDAVGQSQSLLGEVLRHRPYLWTRRCPIAAYRLACSHVTLAVGGSFMPKIVPRCNRAVTGPRLIGKSCECYRRPLWVNSSNRVFI